MKKESYQSQTTFHRRWQSWFGLLYLFCLFGVSFLFFDRELLDYTLLPRYACSSLVFLLSALFIGVKSLSRKDQPQWPRIDLAMISLLLYFVWCTISVSWATNFSEAIFESQKGILGFAAFYVCQWFQFNDENFISRLLKVMTILTGFVLLVACWQILNVDTSLANSYYEISGVSGHKNLFSTVLFLLAGFLSIGYFKLDKNWKKASGLILLIVALLIFYLKTRSVYLGVVTVFAIFIWWKLKERLNPKIASILNVGILILVLLGVIGFLYLLYTNQLIDLLHASRIDEFWKSDTGYERIILWEKTANVIRNSPFFGVGAGNWQIEYPNFNVHGLYSVEVDSTTFQRPHNDWLWVWAETGLLGLLCYFGFFLCILKSCFDNLNRTKSSSDQWVILSQLAFILGFMVIACFSFPKERIEILLLIFTLMGLFYPSSSAQKSRTNYVTKFIFILIILCSSFNLFISKYRMVGEIKMKEVFNLKQQNKWDELVSASELAFSKWYTLDPTSIPIHWYRGTANFVLGNKKRALQNYLQAKEYTPYSQHVQNDLGTCYKLMGEKDKARAYYDEAIRISPLFDDPRVNIAIMYYEEENYVEALDWINSIQNYELKMKYRKIFKDNLSEF